MQCNKKMSKPSLPFLLVSTFFPLSFLPTFSPPPLLPFPFPSASLPPSPSVSLHPSSSPLSPLFLLLVPASFLALVAFARLLAAPFIRSPWYLHKLIAYQLLAPKKLRATPFNPLKP